MTYEEFLNRIINDGIKAAEADYRDGPKLEGSVQGFLACRGKSAEELKDVLKYANHVLSCLMATGARTEEFKRAQCYRNEVEWVMNCVSAALVNQGGKPLLGYLPTARGMMKAAQVLGVTSLQ